MKIKPHPQAKGYNVLCNDAGMPTYCKRRQPNEIPMQGGVPGGLSVSQPSISIMEANTTTSFCGDHCPFFEIRNNVEGLKLPGAILVQLNCMVQPMVWQLDNVSVLKTPAQA